MGIEDGECQGVTSKQNANLANKRMHGSRIVFVPLQQLARLLASAYRV